jgi:ABC transport system ATP-binding/permease protein
MMKIVFIEERSGSPGPERIASGPVIKIGRDPNECQVVFDQAQWPMVSRRHAELRFQDGHCILQDANSSYGTFVNGQKLSHPVEVLAGARIQFGGAGPILIVRSIQADAPAEKPQPAQGFPESYRQVRRVGEDETPQPARPQVQAKPASPPAAKSTTAALEWVSGASPGAGRIKLTKQTSTLGRDPETDIAIDAAAAVVSRKHAQIELREGRYFLVDLGSFNGTLLNDQRVSQPVPLSGGDLIQLGLGGPVLRFDGAVLEDAAARGATPQMGHIAGAPLPSTSLSGYGTIIVKGGTATLDQPGQKLSAGSAQQQLLMQVPFAGKPELTVGRALESDIHVDGLQISNRHAKFFVSNGAVFVEDTNSTNGVYVNGARISGRRQLQNTDVVQIGPFVLQVDVSRGVAVFDTRSKTRIDVIDVFKEVPNRSGRGKIRLLDDVDLSILPNEFVGLLGPSGAGKSTLMDSMNGMRPASGGNVLFNNLDLYQHLDSLKQSIGYVPQDDIIHRELTVYRTLYYVARLRLSRDVSTKEIDQIVGEVMDVTGLAERRDVPVSQLSGGQRKRVSIAVELITKPSVIFLDEPTSGLDPATEEKIMKLFRQIAESGRTVILTTHAMENVRLFDKIVVMMRGKLVFYGMPEEALAHLKAESFKDLYDKLEAPANERIAKMPPLPANASKDQKAEFKRQKEEIAEHVAEEWKKRFQATEQYRRNVVQPLTGLKGSGQVAAPPRRKTTVTDSVRQWATLSRRYLEVLRRDRSNLLILFAQAPIIALLTYLVVGSKAPRDFPFFMMALVAVWFGTSISAREIIRERAVYARERMVNLGLFPYLGSKLFVLSLIVGVQCFVLFGTLKALDIVGLMKLPGYLGGIPQLITLLITAMVGVALGLFVSAVVRTSEMATSLVPLILIPQILFSGLVGVPEGLSKAMGVFMPATWAFDEIKRLSPLDTLNEEGSDSSGPNKGRGLYGHIEDQNDENIADARKDIDRFKDDAEDNLKRFDRDIKDYLREVRTDPSVKQPEVPKIGDAPAVPAAEKVPKDLSNYVDFLHPWGNVALNPLVLIIMFFGLIIATVLALKAQDIG